MPRLIKIPHPKKQIEPEKPPKAIRANRAAKQAFAQNLRDNPTTSESIVRDALLKRRIEFEFQPVLLGYIPDFYFPAQKCIVELDGKCHDPVKDAVRDKHFHAKGFRVLRIKSNRAFYQLDWVIDEIIKFLANRKPKKRTKSARKKTMRKPHRRHQAWIARFETDDLTAEFLFSTKGI